MKSSKLKYTLFLVLISVFCFAQSNQKTWTKISQNNIVKNNQEKIVRKTEPKKALFYKLDITSLKNVIQNAPNRNEKNSNVIFDFPMADGKYESFRINEASVMAPELQNKYPNIRSYIGQSIKNPTTLIRFSITPQGLHAMFLSPDKGTQFIDPYLKNGNNYIVYNKKDLPRLKNQWECGVLDNEMQERTMSNNNYQSRNADDGMMRDYRLAIATTIEYSQYHWQAAGLTAADTEADKKTAVLAAVVVTITRNNFIYERDLSVTMTLVANNDDIIFINSDNLDNDNAGTLINNSQTVINSVIGFSNYDIGHTFSTGGGGLASLGSVCTASKARGVTGSAAPVGDPYDIDYVAHEIGHQFGAPHTFNGTMSNCAGGNREASNAYEPGSGTTIMAYAGICGSDNVQGNSDAYFHQKSLQMIWDTISSTCATQTATGNSAPTSMAGSDYTIPISTPYKLTGSSTDSDGTNTHTYTWEQYNLGSAGVPQETNVTGPMVRSFEGTSNPIRYIPRLQDIVQLGGISTEWEKLPSVSRNQAFRLTVRDNDVNGGQTAVDEMITTVTNAAGPFVVTSQNADGITWLSGESRTITWDVAGTTGNGVNTANVNIWLSTDGGENFDIPLATNVPNNGTYNFNVPSDIVGAYCRVMVEGSGNIFFNINSNDFAINATVQTTCTTYSSASNLGLAIPDGAGANMQGTPLFNDINISDTGTVDEIKVTVDVTHTYIGDLLVQIQDPNDAQFVNAWARTCNDSQYGNINVTFDDTAPAIACATPTTGTYAPESPLSTFNGVDQFGNWQIVLVDFYNQDTGTLNSWSIELCTTEITPLSVNEFSIENSLQIFPNPNNGEFNVKFNTKSNTIDISVYDIRGRSIINKNYTNVLNEFNENINLANVESGMYLLSVKDGVNTITKKIMVE